MYGLPLLHGNVHNAFTGPRSAVITEELAAKLFGGTDVLGKTVSFTGLSGKTTDYAVSAVLKNGAYTSVTHLFSNHGFAMFIPFDGNDYYPTGAGEDNWNGFSIPSFIQLRPGVKPEQLSEPIKKLLKQHSTELIAKNLAVICKPLNTYYLEANNAAIGKMLSILTLVAISILLLAAINFVNIMIGTSSYRIREIGLRKVFGGSRQALVLQYLMESVVLTFFAALLSLLFYALLRPLFNNVLDTTLPSVADFDATRYAQLALLVLAVGVLAGLYPALILSGLKVVSSVKGKPGSKEKGSWIRSSLLLAQFTIAIAVIIFSLVLSQQVNYFFKKDLGYNKDQLLVITAFPKKWDSAGVANMESVRNSLLRVGAVKDASLSFDIPDKLPPGHMQVIPQGALKNGMINLQSITVDERFASTYGMHLLEGRFLRQDYSGFSGEAVINESALKSFGWKSASGKIFTIPDGGGDVKVVGVVKDFHLASLHAGHSAAGVLSCGG